MTRRLRDLRERRASLRPFTLDLFVLICAGAASAFAYGADVAIFVLALAGAVGSLTVVVVEVAFAVRDGLR
jgi:hypothetical protein